MSEEIEMLDVYDIDNLNVIDIREKNEVHAQGLIHREIVVFVINEKNQLLIQKRSPNKKQHPNKWGMLAGHVNSGEEPIKAALRETKEEIGINISESDLKFINTIFIEVKNNRYYNYIYLLRTDKRIDEMTMQESEVCELAYIDIEKLKERVKNNYSELTLTKNNYFLDVVKDVEKVIYGGK